MLSTVGVGVGVGGGGGVCELSYRPLEIKLNARVDVNNDKVFQP